MKNPNDNKDLLWENVDGFKGLESYKKSMTALKALHDKAVKRGCLQGRILSEQVADGYAHYQIIKENKKSCRLRHVRVGDGYMVRYWGEETTLDKGEVIAMLAMKQNLDHVFDNNKPKFPKVFVDGYGEEWEGPKR